MITRDVLDPQTMHLLGAKVIPVKDVEPKMLIYPFDDVTDEAMLEIDEKSFNSVVSVGWTSGQVIVVRRTFYGPKPLRYTNPEQLVLVRMPDTEFCVNCLEDRFIVDSQVSERDRTLGPTEYYTLSCGHISLGNL